MTQLNGPHNYASEQANVNQTRMPNQHVHEHTCAISLIGTCCMNELRVVFGNDLDPLLSRHIHDMQTFQTVWNVVLVNMSKSQPCP